MPKVRFLNEDVTVEVPDSAVLRDVALDQGIEIYRGMWTHINCAGRGICGRCKVWVTGTGSEMRVSDRSVQERFRRISGQQRLACQVLVLGDIDIRTRPIGPAQVQLKADQSPDQEPSYKEAAEAAYVQAKADAKKAAELAAKKAAAKKKAAEEQAKKEAEEQAKKEAEPPDEAAAPEQTPADAAPQKAAEVKEGEQA